MTASSTSLLFLALQAFITAPVSGVALSQRQVAGAAEAIAGVLGPAINIPLPVDTPAEDDVPADTENVGDTKVTTTLTWDGQPVEVDMDVEDLKNTFLEAMAEDDEDDYDGDVEIAATRLVRHTGCNALKKRLIYSGWRSSWNIMNVLHDEYENLNLNEASAVEYLGAPAYTKDSLKNIKGVYKRWSTIQPGYVSTPFDWRIHVRCDDPSSLCKNPCDPDPKKRGPWAYTTNKDAKSGLARINFCPRYFMSPTLKQVMKDGKAAGEPGKFDVSNYLTSKASVWAHELMHIDWAIDAGRYGDQSHVTDLTLVVRDPTGKRVAARATGPQMTKALARYIPDTAFYTLQNADNLALYALVRYIQKDLGNVYPHLPMAPEPPERIQYSEATANLPFDRADDRGWVLYANGTALIAPMTNLWSDANLNSECEASAINSDQPNVLPDDPSYDEDGPAVEVTFDKFASEADLGADYMAEFDKWAEDFYKVECFVPSGCTNAAAPNGCAVLCT